MSAKSPSLPANIPQPAIEQPVVEIAEVGGITFQATGVSLTGGSALAASVFLLLVGALISFLTARFKERYQFRKELKENSNIDVSGTWYAAWQTSIDGTQNINTEEVKLAQKGKTVRILNVEKSPENPEGGYLWTGQLQFLHGSSLMGWYSAKEEENNASRGMLYFSYASPRKTFIGKWVGAAYDGALITGFVILMKDREKAKAQLLDFISKHPQDLRLISDGH